MSDTQTLTRSGVVRPSLLGLRGITLLAGLETEALEDLAQHSTWRRYTSGQRVISREAHDQDVYLIVSGKVRITAYSAAGRQVTYRDIGGGDWFGDLSAIDGRSRSADVDALEDTLLASITPAVFKRLLHQHPVVCDRVLDRLVSLVRDLSDRIFDFSTLGVQNRVHAELLRLAAQAGIRDNTARLDPAPKHSDIASRVGTYREQVTREVSGLAKQGLIRREGKAVVLCDVRRLEGIVDAVRRSA